MKLRKYITKTGRQAANSNQTRFLHVRSNFKFDLLLRAIILLFAVYSFQFSASAQKISVLVPQKSDLTERFVEKFRESLSVKLNVLDAALSEMAFHSTVYENPFNLSVEESKNIGAAIGCEYFILVKSGIMRRSAFQREEFYESFAAIYVVSTRTGRLVFWKLQNFEALKPKEAEKLLMASTENLASEIYNKTQKITKEEINEKPAVKIEEVPDETAPDAKTVRPPLPYKRLKPEYTSLAYIYDIKATIDISVDLGENGEILRTEIRRWAGYNLDESVNETVRRMNWRPATRNGKALPMRVLLRYNFKRIERE